ncbi:hypothetical protein QTH90_30970 [Variovorax sp. J2P1-59]|uniref:hypothetical protein n=1 Tax=Variovorax flavidus TaxID=3053501 RepID=UPI002574F28B|nr:hypothetical protein [Variovorax sp. J2P1-59]MDM0078864.1 hypothetical protein [Variovorax sp. J2P1-59]
MTDCARRIADAFLAEMAIFFKEHDMTPTAEGTPVSTECHGLVPVAPSTALDCDRSSVRRTRQ